MKNIAPKSQFCSSSFWHATVSSVKSKTLFGLKSLGNVYYIKILLAHMNRNLKKKKIIAFLSLWYLPYLFEYIFKILLIPVDGA